MSEPVGFLEALAVHERRDPDRVAVICDGERLTRAELARRSVAVAAELGARGVGPDRIVAIVSPNSVDLFVTVVAAWRLGAMAMPLSHRMPGPELDAVLAVADPACVVREPIAVAASPAEVSSPAVPLRRWKAMATGGSTGVPKVVIDEAPPLVDPFGAQNHMRVDGVMLVGGPMYHSGPFINAVRGLLCGSTVVVMSRFDPERVLALVEDQRVEWAFLVPTMQHRIWRLGEAVRARYDVSSLRSVVSSGGPYPAWLKTEMIGWLGADAIHEAYGGTEQIGGCAISGAEALRKPGSVGRVRAGFELSIRDDDGNELPAGQVGHICFRPLDRAPRFRYVGVVDGALAAASDGWGTFGDLGHVDDEGYLFIADRRSDLIVTGGANVYPREVEAAIESHPLVRSSAVIGLPDDDLGQRVHAVVDVASVAPTDELGAELRAHVAAQLAPYKVPRVFELVHDPLRDEAGKVRRAALRDARMRPHTER